MTALLRYDAACRALAEAKSVDEVTEWVDKAAAVREYGRRIKNRQLEIDAIEIRVRAKKRRGELLLKLKDEGRLHDGRRKQSPEDDRLTLDELGVSKNESAEDQTIAKIEGNAFERLVARCRAYTEAHPEKHAFDVLKPPPEGGPVNGARAIMGSRVEPDDSLDYFPTPPWATRALIECVFGKYLTWPAAFFKGKTAWEPAAGEGHISEVLAEYFGTVHGTDIFDYAGADGRLPPQFAGHVDFLNHECAIDADWIITNPPFKDKTEAFLFRALDLARCGVALFVRMQWLETKGRYERIFRDNPPTIVAFFSERVPLCKGEWKPDGDTATAYVWLVWIRDSQPLAPYWIPPTCREDLTRADDAERFTAHPVIKRERPTTADGSPIQHDSESGEVIEAPSPGETIMAKPIDDRSALLKQDDDDTLDIPAFLRRQA